MLGIAEMFEELDGREQYDQAIVDWARWRLSQNDQSKRDWRENPLNRRKERARNRDYYARNQDRERARIRAAYEARRVKLGITPRQPAAHGTTSKYNTGCRCDACRSAATAARAARRARGGK